MTDRRLTICALATIASVSFLQASEALAVDCPPDAKSCKVLVLTDEQASNFRLLIENSCVSGPFKQVEAMIRGYLDLIDKAPAGEVKKP